MQTAVEYIFEQLEEQGLIFLTTKTNEMTISISASDYLDIKRLSKEMEKQQIIDAYKFGLSDEYVIGSEQYYNETYGSKGSDETNGNNVEKVPNVTSSQTERIYSEEEVLEIVSNCDGSISQAKKWFEQFKKK